jgi:hypothetical protein
LFTGISRGLAGRPFKRQFGGDDQHVDHLSRLPPTFSPMRISLEELDAFLKDLLTEEEALGYVEEMSQEVARHLGVKLLPTPGVPIAYDQFLPKQATMCCSGGISSTHIWVIGTTLLLRCVLVRYVSAACTTAYEHVSFEQRCQDTKYTRRSYRRRL